jgi:flagellar biosynthesis/type III secretory pathway protein FliH
MSLKHIVTSLAALAVIAAPAGVFAQTAIGRPSIDPRYRSSGDVAVSYYEARRVAYDQGFREGVKRGEQDARRGSRFGYHDVREFQRADKGYHRGLGDRERYRQIFRDGFAAGYAEGYARFSRNDRRSGPYPQGSYGGWGSGRYGGAPARYSSPAFDTGMREGYEKGLEDARKNRSYDPVRHSWYRSGDRHYNSRYGPREDYKDLYRRGFQRGYERGYQEARYRY